MRLGLVAVFFCLQQLTFAQADSAKYDFDQLDQRMLQQGMMRNLSEALQSVSPDLMVSHPGANPNLTVDMTYRGLNTLRLNAKPQFFLEGMPVFNPDMIDPVMIGQVNFPGLRRSSKNAMFAASGLFELSDLSNEEEGWHLSFLQQVSNEQLIRPYEVLDAAEFRRFNNSSNDFGQNTDWMDVISRNGMTHQSFLQTGYKNSWLDFSISGSFQDVSSIQRDAGNQLFNGLSSLEINLPKYGLRFSGSGLLLDRNAAIGALSVFHGAVGMNPTVGLNENPPFFYLFGGNPNLMIENQDRTREEQQTGVKGGIQWDFLPKYTLELSYSRSFNNAERREQLNSIYEGANGDYYLVNSYQEQVWQSFDFSIARSWSVKESNHTLSVSYQGQQFDLKNDFYSENVWSAGANTNWNSDTTKGRFNTNAFQIDYQLSGSALNAFGFVRSSASSNLGANLGRQLFFGGEVSYDLDWMALFVEFSKLGLIPRQSGLSQIQDKIYYTSDGLQVERILYDNPNLNVETTNTFEMGSYFSISRNIRAKVNYYHARSSGLMDMLFLSPYENSSIFVPVNSFPTWVNFMEMTNAGFNIEADISNLNLGSISLQQSVFFGFRKSFIEDLTYDQFNSYDGRPLFDSFANRDLAVNWLEEGEELGKLYLPKFEGVTGDGQWSVNYDDWLGNDRNTHKGNGLPSMQLGSFTQLDFNNWSLSFRLRAVTGHSIFNNIRYHYQTMDNSGVWNRLASFNEIENLGVTTSYNLFSDFFVEKSGFLQLSYIRLSRRFELKQSGQITLQGTVNNLFTLTRYSGSDPDIRMSSGYENSQNMSSMPAFNSFLIGTDSPATWPLSRAFSFSVQYSF